MEDIWNAKCRNCNLFICNANGNILLSTDLKQILCWYCNHVHTITAALRKESNVIYLDTLRKK